jgi:hypothetical protein
LCSNFVACNTFQIKKARLSRAVARYANFRNHDTKQTRSGEGPPSAKIKKKRLTRLLYVPRRALLSDSVLPACAILLCQLFAMNRETRQAGYRLFPDFRITVAVAAVGAIFFAGTRASGADIGIPQA